MKVIMNDKNKIRGYMQLRDVAYLSEMGIPLPKEVMQILFTNESGLILDYNRDKFYELIDENAINWLDEQQLIVDYLKILQDEDAYKKYSVMSFEKYEVIGFFSNLFISRVLTKKMRNRLLDFSLITEEDVNKIEELISKQDVCGLYNICLLNILRRYEYFCEDFVKAIRIKRGGSCLDMSMIDNSNLMNFSNGEYVVCETLNPSILEIKREDGKEYDGNASISFLHAAVDYFLLCGTFEKTLNPEVLFTSVNNVDNKNLLVLKTFLREQLSKEVIDEFLDSGFEVKRVLSKK